MKNNSHKKLYNINNFCRHFYCQHARLNQLRNDKHAARVASRRNNKRETKERWDEV